MSITIGLPRTRGLKCRTVGTGSLPVNGLFNSMYSPALVNKRVSELTTLVMSLMNKLNKTGPKTVSRGTPDISWAHSDFAPFTTTRWLR